MMSLKQISTRMEISFWQLVIQLLSESHTIQRIISWIYHRGLPSTTKFIQGLDFDRVLRWAAVGLALGFMTGLLSTLVRI